MDSSGLILFLERVASSTVVSMVPSADKPPRHPPPVLFLDSNVDVIALGLRSIITRLAFSRLRSRSKGRRIGNHNASSRVSGPILVQRTSRHLAAFVAAFGRAQRPTYNSAPRCAKFEDRFGGLQTAKPDARCQKPDVQENDPKPRSPLRRCQEPRCSFAYFLTTRETARSFD